MIVTWVVDPTLLDIELPVYRSLMSTYEFLPGNTYAEFTEGDKIAEYGLTALVVGGGAALAAKSGVLKWLWKLIAVAAVAIGGFLKKLFGKKKKV